MKNIRGRDDIIIFTALIYIVIFYEGGINWNIQISCATVHGELMELNARPMRR